MPIKSDDPKAIEKLTEKLEKLENAQKTMKSRNAYFRKNGTMLGCPDISDETAHEMDQAIANGYSWEKQPYAAYILQNNNQEIHRIRKRIEQLTKDKEIGFVGWEFNGGKAVPNTDINRLQLFFDEKPSADQREELKRNGFKWAPSEQAWQRQLNSNAIYSASLIGFIQPKDNRNIIKMQPKAPVKSELDR